MDEKIINLMEIEKNLKNILDSVYCIEEEITFLKEISEDIGTDYTETISDKCCYVSHLIDCMKYRLTNIKDEVDKGII